MKISITASKRGVTDILPISKFLQTFNFLESTLPRGEILMEMDINNTGKHQGVCANKSQPNMQGARKSQLSIHERHTSHLSQALGQL